jgi:menaquinone-dependent protoporphyrinogen oxidase
MTRSSSPGRCITRSTSAALAAFVRRNGDALRRIPTAFVSVSLTAVRTDPASVAAAQACVEAFVRGTGWMPRETWLTAGALAYTRYGLIKKLLMRRIAQRNGGATDITRDHEYTDWARLRSQVRAFLQPLHPEELAEEVDALAAGV